VTNNNVPSSLGDSFARVTPPEFHRSAAQSRRATSCFTGVFSVQLATSIEKSLFKFR